MKTPVMTSIHDALTHATFDDEEVGDRLNDLLKELDVELHDQGYEAGAAVEQAASRLDNAVGEADNKEEELAGKDEEDEDAG